MVERFYEVPIAGSRIELEEHYQVQLEEASVRITGSEYGDFALHGVEAESPQEAEEWALDFLTWSPRHEVVPDKARPTNPS